MTAPQPEVDAPAGEAVLHTDRPYRLHPQVALRPEPFGALAYHYGNRRLVFLKSTVMVTIVRSLAEQATVGAALDAAVADGSISRRQRPSYERALATLVTSEIICERSAA